MDGLGGTQREKKQAGARVLWGILGSFTMRMGGMMYFGAFTFTPAQTMLKPLL